MRVEYPEDKDIELWVASGHGWKFPIRCRHAVHDSVPHMHIKPALPLNFDQSDVLQSMLGAKGAHDMRSGGWLIRLDAFSELFEKAPGITPEAYFYWNGEKVYRTESQKEDSIKKKREKTKYCDEFVVHIANASGLDESVARLFYLAMLQELPGWLLSGKPIDLGVLKLWALPYRKNWKELLVARYPTFKKLLLIKDARQIMSLAFTSASRLIRSTELTECKEHKSRALCMWNVEVEHDPSWEKVVSDVEAAAAGGHGGASYVRRWAARISQLEDTIYALLSEHLRKENSPTCRLHWSRGERISQFVQAAPTVLGTPQVIECDSGSGQSTDDFLSVEDSTRYLEAKAASLLSLSVEKRKVDVRVSQRDLQEIADIPEGDSGMLVLDSTGGQAAGQGVLDGEHGPEATLDKQ